MAGFTSLSNYSGEEYPNKSTKNWSTQINSFFEAIDNHDHSSGKGVQIPTGGLADDAVTDAKIRLTNDGYLTGRNNAGSADINIVKVNTSDELVLGEATSVDNLKFDTNTISSTNTNGDINLTPNGTGRVVPALISTFSASGSIAGGGGTADIYATTTYGCYLVMVSSDDGAVYANATAINSAGTLIVTDLGSAFFTLVANTTTIRLTNSAPGSKNYFFTLIRIN